jgi:hypothetical protein
LNNTKHTSISPLQPLGTSSRSSPSGRSPQASINQAFDEEENSEELELKEKDVNLAFRTSSPSTSYTRGDTNGREMEYIMSTLNDTDRHQLRDMPTGAAHECRHRVPTTDRHRETRTAPTTQNSSPKYGHKPVNKTMSSDESLLSGAGSLVIEESASSGGESSPGSGVVYKNIIINLGGLGLAGSDYNDLSGDVGPTSSSTDRLPMAPKVNNIDTTAPEVKPHHKHHSSSK